MTACTQPSSSTTLPLVTDTLTYRLGSTPVNLILRTYSGPSSLFYIHLHDNEITAKKAAITMLEKYGGQLLSIENNEQRNISFRLDKQTFTVDPNRIFSNEGIDASLKLLSKSDPDALQAVKGFAEFILKQLPDSALIVAPHNNTDERFSIHSYTIAPLKDEAAAVHINPENDADDFILTTDSVLYNFYKSEDINVILQREGDLTDDGSLSIFFGKKKRAYLNVEAQHGHKFQQILLLEKLYSFLGFEKKVFREKHFFLECNTTALIFALPITKYTS
jgi:hypothetical protein